ncbi:hypothetical protein CSKR_111866 [Clonorchis sinensis]|uniref:Glycosyltransferase family 92 protein n=1 Tax=Clonorchis sinensis TaxID=79923 RepID=A0A419PV83_CLOSI|nr:hypothetical protein CSKR_111866 [Clonorchis sinensis]
MAMRYRLVPSFLASLYLLFWLVNRRNGPSSPSDTSTPENVFPVSAYHEPGGKMVRVFFLKHIAAHPDVYCYFVNSLQGGLRLTSTGRRRMFSKSGYPFHFDALEEYKGKYRGYTAYCPAVPDIQHVGDRNRLFILLHIEPGSRTFQLPVQTGRISENSYAHTKHRISMCMTPWFKTETFDPRFIVEYIEMQRAMGVTQMVVYLAENPDPKVKRVLSAYNRREKPFGATNNRMFEIKLVNWVFPIENASNTTWYFDQVLSFNDCLHRIGNETQHIFFGDFDEVLVPDQSLPARYGALPTWNDVIDTAQNSSWYEDTPTICFPSYYFPPPVENNFLEKSIFDRTNSTVETYPERKKCLVRPGDVEEVYVHWPRKPANFRIGEDLAVIFHYRVCLRKDYNPCPPDTRYAPNHRLNAYRNLIKNSVAMRLSSL